MKANLFYRVGNLLVVAVCFANSSLPTIAQGVHYEVFETSTNGRVTGWEHELTTRDPNLANWHWEPMGVHGHQRSVRRYVDNNGELRTEFVRTPDLKPVHLPLPTAAHNTKRNFNASNDISGRLLKRTQPPPLVAQFALPAAYAQYAKTECIESSFCRGARAHVAGSIVHASTKRITN